MTYRTRTRACPRCGAPMEELPVRTDPRDASAHAEVDRCPRCGGLFLEFFDGEPSAISRGLRDHAGISRPSQRPIDARPEGLRCPDCDAPMILRAYLDEGPELARCETCLAVFLTPEEVDALSKLELSPPDEVSEPSWLERLVRWIPGLS